MNSVFFAALLSVTVGLFAGCGTDPEASYTLALLPSSLALTSDGSDASTIRVTVLDQRGNPPAVGSTVRLTVLNGSVNNTQPETITDANGNVTKVSFATAPTDPAGTAQFRVSCAGEDTMNFRADFEGERANGRPISCNPAPTGDWSLSLIANPRSVSPGAAVTLEVTATQGNGSPAPTGTAVTFTIQDPNPGAAFRLGSGAVQTILTGDDSGMVTNTVVAPSTPENFTVCASFADNRLGTGNPCATVRVGSTTVEGAACFGVYSPSKLPADGQSTSVVSFSVYDESGSPAGGARVDARLGKGVFEGAGGEGNTVSLETDSTGLAEATIVAPASTGSASTVATATVPGMAEPLECEFSDELIFAPPPTCAFDPVSVVPLGQTAPLRVCFDNVGVPVAAGIRVDFELTAAVTGATLIATTAYTGADGCAQTSLVAGSTPGAVTIGATMQFGVGEASCNSNPVLQAGGSPSATQMVLSCSHRNVGVLLDSNGSDTYSSCPIECRANILDAFNNPIVGQAVYFSSEVGTITASAITDERGIATATFTGRGSMPRDVPPMAALGEEGTIGPGGTTINPRDALVTIIASTAGAEEFNDDNGNGVYDEGEFFIDLSEPYIDSNESNTFEPNSAFETFTDVPSNGPHDMRVDGQFDGPNGIWDAQTQIWAATHILYTGQAVAPYFFTYNGAEYRPFVDGSAMGENSDVHFRPRDIYGNSLAAGTSIGASVNEGACLAYKRVEVQELDSFGTFAVRRVLEFYQHGNPNPVSAESDSVDFGRYRTEVEFGLDDGMTIVWSNPPGSSGSVCMADFDWSDTVSPECGGAGANALTARWTVR